MGEANQVPSVDRVVVVPTLRPPFRVLGPSGH